MTKKLKSTLDQEERCKIDDHGFNIDFSGFHMARHMVLIGGSLKAARDVFGPSREDEFWRWVTMYCKLSRSRAGLAIRYAERFSDLKILENFLASAVAVLTQEATPPAAIAEAKRRAESGEMIDQAMAKEIVRRHAGKSTPGRNGKTRCARRPPRP